MPSAALLRGDGEGAEEGDANEVRVLSYRVVGALINVCFHPDFIGVRVKFSVLSLTSDQLRLI